MEHTIDDYDNIRSGDVIDLDYPDDTAAYLDEDEILYDNVKRIENYYINTDLSCRPSVCDFICRNEDNENSIVELAFQNCRMQFYRNDYEVNLKPYQFVIADSDTGHEICTVIKTGSKAMEKFNSHFSGETPEYSILRAANRSDILKFISNCREEKHIVEKTKEFAGQYHLDMKITNAEWQFDRQRLTIYFTAPQRIDFRELVKDLARTFRTRIELRQISTREEAKRMGGIGCCGLTLCCVSLLNDFNHVTLDHARTQQLSNNVSKLSVNCGRLKCCLLYEHETYVKAFEKYPNLDSKVLMPEGKASILKVDIFKDKVNLYFHESGSYKNISYSELKELDNKGKVVRPDGGKGRFFEDDEELKKLEDPPPQNNKREKPNKHHKNKNKHKHKNNKD